MFEFFYVYLLITSEVITVRRIFRQYKINFRSGLKSFNNIQKSKISIDPQKLKVKIELKNQESLRH